MYAVVDVGSNTVRLNIYKIEYGQPVPVLSRKESVGLASYVRNGQMLPAGIQRVTEVLSSFKVLLDGLKISNVHVFATAALRNAKNSRAAVGEIIKNSGMDVHVISGEMEAELDFIGASHALENMDSGILVDIGGGSTEIAVISLGGIVVNKSQRVAGDDLTADIQEYMSRQHNLKVSERMAERIKISVGAALTDLGDEAPEDYVVHGPNRITALPMEVPVCYQEIAHCLEKTIAKIEAAVLSALEATPPELYADIVKNGIYLTGGGANLRGLDKRLTGKINIPFHVAEDPLHSVAKGTGVALKNIHKFSFLM